jgi:outer membrane protein assembly factor BamB
MQFAKQYYEALTRAEVPPAFSTVGSNWGTASNKWYGAAYSDGAIYFAPTNENQVLKYTISSGVSAKIGTNYGTTSLKWIGIVKAFNGRLYCAPFASNQILEINPVTDTTALVGSTLSGSNRYFCGVLAGNGCIYFPPHDASQVLKFNPSTGVTSLIGSSYTGGAKYQSAVLAEDGCIYCAPTGALPTVSRQVLKIDPATDTTSLVGSILSSEIDKWTGGCLAYNGKCYFTPRRGVIDKFLEFDPVTQTSNLVGPSLGTSITQKFGGLVTAPNKKLYTSNVSFINIHEVSFNPLSIVGLFPTITPGHYGQALGNDGCLYACPTNAAFILKIENVGKVNSHMLTLPAVMSELPTSLYNKHQNKF